MQVALPIAEAEWNTFHKSFRFSLMHARVQLVAGMLFYLRQMLSLEGRSKELATIGPRFNAMAVEHVS